MKKRILSLFLAWILAFSAIPAISAEDKILFAENVTTIANYQQFLAFLDNAENSDKAEALLTSDITVPADSEAIGGYTANNLHLDGNGHIIKGLKIKDSLFDTFKSSSVRNLTFDGAEVQSSTPQDFSQLAVIALSVADKSSKITNCVFENSALILPEADADAAFVAVDNSGIVTNCLVKESSVIRCNTENSNEYRAGGITVSNKSGSQVINCLSKVQFDLKSDNDYSLTAGITVSNKGKVDLCYVNVQSAGERSVVADSSSINNSVYKKADGSFVMGKKFYDKAYFNVLAADMSQNVMNFISTSVTSNSLAEEDYPVLWSVQGEEPGLSFDLKTAQVYLMVDETMDKAELKFSLGAQQVSASSGRQYSFALGKFENGSYIRNKLDITCAFPEDSYQMVNSFVYAPAFKFMEDLTNPYENTNYSKKLVTAKHNNNVNTAELELLPYCWSLSLTNVSENDEIVAFEFNGKGTEDNPYKISSEYELKVLSKYVADGKVDSTGKKFSNAHYLLTNDLSDITITPIGQYGNGQAFAGTFDGGAHVIRNLKVTDGESNTNNYFGMFGCVRGDKTPAEIKNLNIINADIATKGDICGIVVAQADNAIINGCVTSGKISGGTQVSGVVGYAHNTKIYNCGSTASITTTSANASAGGVAGYSEGSLIRNCYYSGSIYNNNVVQGEYIKTGGVSGYFENTTLDNCYYNVNNNGDRILFDACVKGVRYSAESELKSESFLESLKQYSEGAGLATFWEKDVNNINSGYPVIGAMGNLEFDITCVSTEAGTVESDVSVAKCGETVTLTVHSDCELVDIQITNRNREVMNVSCIPNADGTYSFKMPAYSVRVVPTFDTDVHLSGRGTKDDPYIVSNLSELKLMSDKCYYNKTPREGCEAYPWAYYELANDIDGNGEVLRPMGNRYYPFNGHFDGNGHTISNLVPQATSQQVSHDYAYPAIFGYCGSAEIHNVTFEGIKLSGSRAAVVASSVWGNTDIYNVTIRNCTFDNVTYAGGFVSQGTNVRIVNCIADNVTFTNAKDSAYVIWNVMDTIYINNILVSDSSGVKKMMYSSNATITVEDYTNYYSCNTDVSEETYIQQSLINQVDESKLSDKDFVAELSENAYYINLNHRFNNFNFWGLGEEVELAHENGVVGILPIHYAAEFSDPKAIEMFGERVTASEIGYTVEITCCNLFDLSNIKITTPTEKSVGYAFVEKENGKYVLAFVMPEEPVVISNSGVVPTVRDIPGTGTAEDPYRISVAEHIKLFADVTNGYKKQYKDNFADVDYIEAEFVLIGNIDMTDYEFTPICQTGLYHKADPAGGESTGFRGKFDGQGHIISNLTLKGSSEHDLSYGLFGTVSGTVKNIGIENFTFSGAGKDSRVGCVAGQVLANGLITDCYAKNVNINTKINTPNGVAGGIAGSNYAGEILNCYTYNVTITAGRAGGIVADNFGDGNNSDGSDRPGKVTNCYTNYANICGRGDSSGSLSSLTEADIRSCEIVYKLSNERADSLWRQGSDKLPAFEGDAVYKNLCKDEVFYSTVKSSFEKHNIDHANGEVRCKNCNHFDSATLITDSNYSSFGLTADYAGMYAVENASNMYWINEQNAVTPIRNGVVLLNDIAINSSVEEWKPMFVDYTDFTLDGRGHTLTLNLDFGSQQKSADFGLFSNFNYGVIKDLVVKGSVTANTTGNVGGLAGSVYRSTFEKVISYVDVTNNCETGGKAGGLAGYYGGQMDYANGYYSRILNCAVYADVKGYEAGGIVGHGWNGKQYYDIKNSAFVGDVTGYAYAGAIIGYHGNNQDAYQCTFKDIYYLEKDGLAFSGGGNTNYTLDSTVASKTQAQFASGEVTYLLNNGKTDNGVWKQNIDNGKAKDALPVHTGGSIYKNTTCIDELVEYSNTKDEVAHDYNNYYVCKKCIGLYPGKIAGIWGFDLGLAGSIELSYYMVIDEEASKDPTARMVFTVPGGSKTNPDATNEVSVPLSEAEFDGTFYYFSCGIPAKEMCSDIYCKLVTDTQESDSFRYSVKEYAEYILANPEGNEDAIPLIKSILNYGAYAQIELEHKTDNLANDSEFITEEEKILPEVDFRPYSKIIVGEQKGVSLYGTSMIHRSTTNIVLYFTFDNSKDVETLDITVNGEKVVPTKNGSYYQIVIDGTPAQAYHLNHVIKVGDMTLYFSIFSSGADVQRVGNDPEKLDLCKAMYVYNREILSYLDSQ